MGSTHGYRGRIPKIDDQAFVAPTAAVVGDVQIGAGSSVWFGTVLRGDVEPIRVGMRTSIQDNAVVHATGGWQATVIGDDVTVGHAAVIHGCRIHDRVLIGMGSIVLDGAEIESDTVLGAGSLVSPRKTLPSGVLAYGRPAKVIRELTDTERSSILESAAVYVQLVHDYRNDVEAY